MKIKILSVLTLAIFTALSTCSPFRIVRSSGEQPAPGEETVSATGCQAVVVNHVAVEAGVGSPIPVHVIVSGNQPNACAQLGEVRLHEDGTIFFVRLVAYISAS